MNARDNDLERDLRAAMRQTYGGVVTEPGVAGRAIRASRQRRRRTAVSAAAAATSCLAAVAAVAYTLNRPSTDTSGAAGPTTAVAGVGFSVPTLHSGDMVRVAGRVLISGSDAVLCPEVASSGDASETIPCRFPQLALSGASATLLSQSSRSGDQVVGTAEFTGAWTPGHLEVRTQTASEVLPPGGNPITLATSTGAPCRPPAAGWAEGSIDWSAEAKFVAAHPDAVVGDSTAYPAPGREILVLAVSNVAQVSHALSAQYPGKLCIVASKFTQAQVSAARAAIQALTAKGTELLDNGFEGFGPGVLNLDGQVHYDIFPAQPDAAIQKLAAEVPAGLVTPHYWITPVTGSS